MILALFLGSANTLIVGLDIYLINLLLLPVIVVTAVLLSIIVALTLGLQTLSLAYKLNVVDFVFPIWVLPL